MADTKMDFEDGLFMELLPDQTIRCTLNSKFFQKYNLSLKDLCNPSKDNEQAKKIFQLIGGRAKNHFSFNLKNNQVFAESIPLNFNLLVLILSVKTPPLYTTMTTSFPFDDGITIESINDKQIRCILKGDFFQTYHFTLGQLHYDTNQIQKVLTMIRNRAKYHISFNLSNDPVIYESVPLIRGAAVVFISKEQVIECKSKEHLVPSDQVTFEDGLCIYRINDRQISVTIQTYFLDKWHISVIDFQQKTNNAQVCMDSILRRLRCYFKCDKSIGLKLDSIAYNEDTIQFLIVPERWGQIIDNRFPDPSL